ncbi:MAG TPA: sodium:solute symporter family protein [Planctomycetota bacterium]|nr:sodium:solute symporter family protein [Planctomycetota bacterium]
MIPAIVVFCYLAIVVYIGIFAFRKGKDSGEDFFLASRSLGPYVFILSLFGTNMTAFAILGSSGLAYQRGVGVYGLMASASGFVIPMTIFFIGTRLWYLGKRYGHMTQVAYFRDRWECSGIGTVIFALTAAMLVPYLIIGTMGGGTTLESISTMTDENGKPVMEVVMKDGKELTRPVLIPKKGEDGKPVLKDGKPEMIQKTDESGKPVMEKVMQPKHWVPYEVGAAVVAIVVMSYVFFGGMRGTAWVNTFQTLLFLCFGSIAFVLISRKLGGFDQIMNNMLENPRTATLLTRERIPKEEFFSYMFIPLSSIMFPHIAIMCMTAEKITHFKKTVILYPLCIAAIWLPSVYMGVIAAHQFPGLPPGDTDDVIPRMLRENTSVLLSGVLGAGIMACVMASDSQILALCTMFTEDIFAYYGGRKKFGEKATVWTGRAFIVGVTLFSYLIALQLKDKEGIFDLAIRFAFSGFASMAPVMLAALFWKRSTKWGALAATLWVAATMIGVWVLYDMTDKVGLKPAPGQPPIPIFASLGNLFLRTPGNVTMYGFLPVMPMCIGSAIIMFVVSLMTRPPSAATLEKYFPSKIKNTDATPAPASAAVA